MSDNSWYDELPVGWHGEFTWADKLHWHECVILPNARIAHKQCDGKWSVVIDPFGNPEFRPLKSDRDRAIEYCKREFFDAISEKCPPISNKFLDELLGRMYDAELLKGLE